MSNASFISNLPNPVSMASKKMWFNKRVAKGDRRSLITLDSYLSWVIGLPPTPDITFAVKKKTKRNLAGQQKKPCCCFFSSWERRKWRANVVPFWAAIQYIDIFKKKKKKGNVNGAFALKTSFSTYEPDCSSIDDDVVVSRGFFEVQCVELLKLRAILKKKLIHL